LPTLINDMKMYLRFALGLRRYARTKISLEQARQTIQRRLDAREDSFLRLIRRGVFQHPQSPYLPLLKWAGCEYSDIRDLVKKSGLESALTQLRQAGVYISFEELKGRAPIRRNGLSYQAATRDFYNPHLKVHYQAETGGSTGVGTRIPMELDHLGEQAAQLMLARHHHNCLDLPAALWRGPIPDGTGLNNVIRAMRHGGRFDKWYVTDLRGEAKPRLTYRLADRLFILASRCLGEPVPSHEPLGPDQVGVLADWAARMCRSAGGCFIVTTASRALRVGIAALDEGWDLSGTVFLLGGEPITPGKALTIKNTGAGFIQTYAMYELGHVAMSCIAPICPDDMHLSMDCFSLITHPHTLPDTEVTVDAANISSLLLSSPIIALNLQVDDHLVLDQRSCGCPLHELGYTTHISKISSYSKLVTEGVTLIGSDVIRVLEQVLPARFGGSVLDYQLWEEEDRMGISRISLVISPDVELDDENEAARVFMQSLRGTDSYSWAHRVWDQSGTMQVKRVQPVSTRRGKHMTLHKPGKKMN
jgi:hypothetical protein